MYINTHWDSQIVLVVSFFFLKNNFLYTLDRGRVRQSLYATSPQEVCKALKELNTPGSKNYFTMSLHYERSSCKMVDTFILMSQPLQCNLFHYHNSVPFVSIIFGKSRSNQGMNCSCTVISSLFKLAEAEPEVSQLGRRKSLVLTLCMYALYIGLFKHADMRLILIFWILQKKKRNISIQIKLWDVPKIHSLLYW